MKFDKKAFVDAIKEPLRLLVLAVIPFGVVYFTELGVEWGIAAVAVLRFIDKYLHSIAAEDGYLKKQGLTGF